MVKKIFFQAGEIKRQSEAGAGKIKGRFWQHGEESNHSSELHQKQQSAVFDWSKKKKNNFSEHSIETGFFSNEKTRWSKVQKSNHWKKVQEI